MHPDILAPEQHKLLPILAQFRTSFSLIGGTAIALHLGHRRSIDFDCMTQEALKRDSIQNILRKHNVIDSILVSEEQELTLACGGVKWTFLQFPFAVECPEDFDGFIRLPSLLSLSAMKAYALSRRAKWKDYVDLYHVFQTIPFADVVSHSRKIFGGEFNEKLFREQLGYFEDIDYEEEVAYMPGCDVPDDTVKQFLQLISIR